MDYSKHKDKEQLQKHFQLLSEYADTASLTLKNHSVNKYWREVGYELDELFELIKVMDANSEADWKKERSKIRS